jgi:4-alpha-glucanotransferase
MRPRCYGVPGLQQYPGPSWTATPRGSPCIPWSRVAIIQPSRAAPSGPTTLFKVRLMSLGTPPAHSTVADPEPELVALTALCQEVGVLTEYIDGLRRPIAVAPETLVRVCAALGAEVSRPADAAEALKAMRAARAGSLPTVLVAWDGRLAPLAVEGRGSVRAHLELEGDGAIRLDVVGSEVRAVEPLPFGYHRLTVEVDGDVHAITVIAAPTQAWRRPDSGGHSWGLGTHLAALRSERSRALGDLRDLETLCHWVGAHGGDLVTVLPLLPTFNHPPAEPSPYSPVSRIFWSELILDLGGAHRPAPPPSTLEVTRADLEVRRALAALPLPDRATLDTELLRYAQFRGAQARLGRNWRDWPDGPRAGRLAPEHIDAEEERFHLKAQTLVREQLGGLLRRLKEDGVRVGLDLAVGVHPDGYDPWSRQVLFADGMSVGAPPDPGFPSGQDLGFMPVLPEASRRDGHRYIAASIAHQASLAGVLRVDHVMALQRLYWIPHGFGLHEGTYVRYPVEELFAVLTLESHRHRCEIIGENLGTVPPEIDEALPHHHIWGMYLAEFEAMGEALQPPTERQVALIGTHDTPTLAGWVDGIDIDERVRCGLLKEEAAPAEREARAAGAKRLAELLDASLEDLPSLLGELLEWLGASSSPLVIPWLEDLWLEADQVNLPGTRSSERPNWQRPMGRLLDEALSDPSVEALARRLHNARIEAGKPPASPTT